MPEQVPPTMRFALDGEMPPWLLAKDLILHIIGEISVAGERNSLDRGQALPPCWEIASIFPRFCGQFQCTLPAAHTCPPTCVPPAPAVASRRRHVPRHGVCGRRRQGHEHGGAHDHLQHGGGGGRQERRHPRRPGRAVQLGGWWLGCAGAMGTVERRRFIVRITAKQFGVAAGASWPAQHAVLPAYQQPTPPTHYPAQTTFDYVGSRTSEADEPGHSDGMASFFAG